MKRSFTDGGNWPGQHMWKMRARPNGRAVVLLQMGTEGWDWRPQASSKWESLGSWVPGWCEGWERQQKAGERGFPESASSNCTHSGSLAWTQPLGWQGSTWVSTSHQGAGTSGFSLQGKQLELLPPQCHLQRPGPRAIGCTCWGFKALDLLGRCSHPTHVGHLDWTSWGEGISLPFDPEDSDGKVRSLSNFRKCGILV